MGCAIQGRHQNPLFSSLFCFLCVLLTWNRGVSPVRAEVIIHRPLGCEGVSDARFATIEIPQLLYTTKRKLYRARRILRAFENSS
jgi:hypothetical protein